MRKSVDLRNAPKQTRQNMRFMQTLTCTPRIAPATQNLLRERRRERTQERTTTHNKIKGNITTNFSEMLKNSTATGRSQIVGKKMGQQLSGDRNLKFKTLAGKTKSRATPLRLRVPARFERGLVKRPRLRWPPPAAGAHARGPGRWP